MSNTTYLTADQLVTTLPCLLLSVVLTPDSQGVGDLTVYNGQGAETGYEVLQMRSGAGITQQVRFEHAVLDRGLYVDIGSNITCCVIEWLPVGYPGAEPEWLQHLRESLPQP